MANNILKMFMSGSKSAYGSLIAKANSLGYTLPSVSTLLHLETFLNGLEAQGIYQKLDYLRVSAYNDVNVRPFALINIAKHSTPPNATTYQQGTGTVDYTASGFKLNSTNGTNYGVILTNFSYTSPNKTGQFYSYNSATRLYVLYGMPTAGTFDYTIDGIVSVTAEVLANSSATGLVKITQGTTANAANINTTGIGMKALTRTGTSNTGGRFYNKNVITTLSTSANVTSNVYDPFREGYSNNIAGVCGYSLSMIGGYLGQTEVEFVRSSFNTYLVNIGLTAFA